MPPSFLSNLPAARLTVSYLLHEPSSLLPHQTIPTLLSLPLPLGPSLPTKPTIRALVLDKDNTLCPPNTTLLHPAFIAKIEKIKQSPEFAANRHSVVIVSNTAGSSASNRAYESEADDLEAALGIPVLRQPASASTATAVQKKPLNGPAILSYFREKGVTADPAEIAVVGDRLTTDGLLARETGSWSVWVRDGWRNPELPGRDYRGWLAKMEARLESILRTGLGWTAPLPRGYNTGNGSNNGSAVAAGKTG